MLHLLTAINTFICFATVNLSTNPGSAWCGWYGTTKISPASGAARLHLSRQRMELMNDIIPNNPCMYGIFPYLYHKNQLNVGKYTTHGWYGNDYMIRIHDYKIKNKLTNVSVLVDSGWFTCRAQFLLQACFWVQTFILRPLTCDKLAMLRHPVSDNMGAWLLLGGEMVINRVYSAWSWHV